MCIMWEKVRVHSIQGAPAKGNLMYLGSGYSHNQKCIGSKGQEQAGNIFLKKRRGKEILTVSGAF